MNALYTVRVPNHKVSIYTRVQTAELQKRPVVVDYIITKHLKESVNKYVNPDYRVSKLM